VLIKCTKILCKAVENNTKATTRERESEAESEREREGRENFKCCHKDKQGAKENRLTCSI